MNIYADIYLLPPNKNVLTPTPPHPTPTKETLSGTGISEFPKVQTLTRLMEFIWPFPGSLYEAKSSYWTIIC